MMGAADPTRFFGEATPSRLDPEHLRESSPVMRGAWTRGRAR